MSEKDFLKEGEQTQITAKIQEVSDSISGKGLDYVTSALAWINENLRLCT